MRNWLIVARGSTTQIEVAKMCNISQNHYSWIECGLRTPSVKTAQKIANALGFDWTMFFQETCVSEKIGHGGELL